MAPENVVTNGKDKRPVHSHNLKWTEIDGAFSDRDNHLIFVSSYKYEFLNAVPKSQVQKSLTALDTPTPDRAM